MIPKVNILSKDISYIESSKNVFVKQGYEVDTFQRIDENSINKIHNNQPDIIFLDLAQFNTDGIELCQQLKSDEKLKSRIVLYTEQKEDYIQIEAFKAGADDFIIKPISSRLLIKRIEALLRREVSDESKTKRVVSVDGLMIDRDSYLVFSHNKEIVLPRKEFEILFLLLKFPDNVFSREEIFQKVWNDSNCPNNRIIDVHIRKIREKIGGNLIETVKGVGYRLRRLY